MTALYIFPAWVLLVLAVVTFAAAACGGLVVVRKRFARVDFRANNEAIWVFSGIVGSLFTVTVAFIIAIVWQEYNSSSQRVAGEVVAAGDLWHVSAGFPAPMERELRSTVFAYGRLMVDDEWPAMRSGGDSPRAEALLTRAIEDVARFRPAQPGEGAVQSSALAYLGVLHDARHHRLDDNRRGLAPFEWATLLFVTCAVIGFLYMVGLPNMRAQLMTTAAVAAVIASMFVLIFELDYPFRGDLGIPSDLWQAFETDHPTPATSP